MPEVQQTLPGELALLKLKRYAGFSESSQYFPYIFLVLDEFFGEYYDVINV